MDLREILHELRLNRDFMRNVVAWERLPARPAQFAPLDQPLAPQITAVLQKRGFHALYTHQARAISAALAGQNVVIATSTASGKTLCYTVPVLQRLLEKPKGRALYLFPTKALAHDQLAETAALLANGRLPIHAATYDGDTPQSQRSKIRQSDGILITNPDMLHAGILPYHTSWRTLFSNLEVVVLDEIHAYRGVLGSHIANVLRRLRRLCAFYGSNPQFICCSATIANPQAHAERLVEAPFTLVDESMNGSPMGEKQIILYNPPIVDEELGLRSSTVLTAKETAVTFLAQNIQTIVFARARQTVELLLTYLRDELAFEKQDEISVMGYRGGYLPLERREIEHGLRTGQIRGVVATNALELGIDIGELSAAVLTGYPGSIASTWQQAGRAGRRAAQSVAVMVAGNSALDQYICQHPRYLFGGSPEYALTNPDNGRILANHLACAAFELPFREGECFGTFGPVDTALQTLVEKGDLHHTRTQYHWLGDGTPSSHFSLRTSSEEVVVIHDIGGNPPIVIGEMDLASVPSLLHEGAIYMHLARTFLVERLDWNGRLAYVRPVEVDYYTRANVGSSVRDLRPQTEQSADGLLRAYGEVTVVSQATSYRKIKRYSSETLGYGEIDLPEMVLETSGYWLIFSESLAEQLYEAGILLRPNDYGPNWQEQRQRALERDGFRCRVCNAEGLLHVHHIRPFREYGYVRGENTAYQQANQLDNLVTLCPACHRRAEAGQQTRSALGGLAYVLGNLAPLFLMCDPADIQVVAESRSPLTQAPTVLIFERIPAGVGFSQRLFEIHTDLLAGALELIHDCQCRDGCPACVGPPGDIGPDTKDITRQLLRLLLHGKNHV